VVASGASDVKILQQLSRKDSRSQATLAKPVGKAFPLEFNIKPSCEGWYAGDNVAQHMLELFMTITNQHVKALSDAHRMYKEPNTMLTIIHNHMMAVSDKCHM